MATEKAVRDKIAAAKKLLELGADLSPEGKKRQEQAAGL